MSIEVNELDVETKTVFLKDLFQQKMKQAKVSPTSTVEELKRVIEKEFNYDKNHLNGYSPRLINKGHRTGTLLDDDRKTLAQYDIKNMATITFSKLKNKGGK
jgi:hypothetical protein